MDWTTVGVFLLAALVILLAPGPVVLYVVSRSIGQGTAAGIVSAAGAAAGTLVHAGAAALGLSAIVLSSALIFQIVKLAGAAYLIWIGWQAFRRRGGWRATALEARGYGRVFRDGLIINIFNPKTALFFIAFLPQFVHQGSAMPVVAQLFLLGGIFALAGLVTDAAYAFAAGRVHRWLRGPVGATWLARAMGTSLIGLGVTTAFLQTQRT
jgi:threonine/homoserine/homoserine lactone efflux protein